MKTSKQNLRVFLATALLAPLMVLGFAACGQNSSTATAAAVPIPATGTGVTSLDPDGCAVGQIDASGYGCLSVNNCPSGMGWATNATPPQCVSGTLITTTMISGSTGYSIYSGMMSISNSSQFQLLMQYAGLCNPYWGSGSSNYGSFACSTYTDYGGYVQLQFQNAVPAQGTSGSALMVVGAGSLYGGSPTIKFSTQAATVLYNNSLGMQVIATTTSGQDQGLRLIISNGVAGQSSSMSGTLQYQNVNFATVNLVPQQ